MDVDWEGRFEQVAILLPRHLRQRLLTLTAEEKKWVEEIRLRVGQPLTVQQKGQEQEVPYSAPVTENDLRLTLELASQASVHMVLDKLRQGFLTVPGGHRIGICGTTATRDGEIGTMRYLTSLSIRVAKEMPGSADQLLPQLVEKGVFQNTLILAPPGAGKTTLLRDVIRAVSDGGDGFPARRVGVVDERGELAAVYRGTPQMNLGRHTDILDGSPRAEGLMLLLRGMTPQILAMDEITAEADLEALLTAAGCGVGLLATAHGRTPKELTRRPLYRRLVEERIFRRYISIEDRNGQRAYQVWREEELQ